MPSPFILVIIGGSASGKTTLARHVAEALSPVRVAIVPEDAYYFSVPSGAHEDGTPYNFDHPQTKDLDLLAQHVSTAQAGDGFDLPTYDFATHTRQAGTIRIDAPEVLILEGMHCLGHAGVREIADFAVFVEADEPVREQRRIARDVAERGRESESTRRQFREVVAPMHRKHVEPLRAHATLVVHNDAAPDALARAAHELAMNVRSILAAKT